ncbi:MAG: hypothetical protein QOJ91_834 [Sphingomonadales bacterium]|jgi:hypothetical protein|nr:hypothetical protein [Sphingomonadales bacterium]
MARTNINFEEFTNAAMAAVTKSLTENTGLFPNPEITVGIVIRRQFHVEVPNLNQGPATKL